MHMLYAFLAAVFSAISVILAKLGFQSGNQLESTFETTLRMFFTFLILFVILIVKGINVQDFKNIQPIDWVYIILSGVSFGISSFFFYLALSKGDSAIILALDRSSLVLTAILGIILLGEALTISKIIGVFLILIGILILNM